MNSKGCYCPIERIQKNQKGKEEIWIEGDLVGRLTLSAVEKKGV